MSGRFDIVDATVQALTEHVDWSYYNKKEFEDIDKEYLPVEGEGETFASQIVTAINKLIYKWYNDGDVFDNVNSSLEGWANDLSSYANWLYKYVDGTQDILKNIYGMGDENDYETLLRELADEFLDKDFLAQAAKAEKQGSIYDCEGPFEFSEYNEEDYYDDDEYLDNIDESKKLSENKKSGYVIFIKDYEDGYNYQGSGGRSRVRLDSDNLDVFDTVEQAQKGVNTYKNPKKVKIMKFDGENVTSLDEEE